MPACNNFEVGINFNYYRIATHYILSTCLKKCSQRKALLLEVYVMENSLIVYTTITLF